MKLVLLIGLLVCLQHCRMADAYGHGAPPEACDDMVPQHGQPVQPLNESPYKVSIDKTSIKAGEKVKVVIDGAPYKGFFLQARMGNTAIGQFESGPQIGLVNCSGVASTGATHTKPVVTKSTTVVWNSPRELSGNVVFRATVAEDGSKYWVGHESEALSVQ